MLLPTCHALIISCACAGVASYLLRRAPPSCQGLSMQLSNLPIPYVSWWLLVFHLLVLVASGRPFGTSLCCCVCSCPFCPSYYYLGMGSIVKEWMANDTLVARAAYGKIAVMDGKGIKRRNVLDNCDVISPVISHLGLRPTVDMIEEHVTMFFDLARPKGKPRANCFLVALLMHICVLGPYMLLHPNFCVLGFSCDSYTIRHPCCQLRCGSQESSLGHQAFDLCVQSGCQEGTLPTGDCHAQDLCGSWHCFAWPPTRLSMINIPSFLDIYIYKYI